MGGNPAGSKWRSTSQAERKKKRYDFTLSDEANAKLNRVAGPGMRSQMIERMIMEWEEKAE